MTTSIKEIKNLYELYEKVYTHLDFFQKQYAEAEKHLKDFKVEDEASRKARIKNFDLELKKIGYYYQTVEYFRLRAEKNITTKNIVSLKALELDFNSLRNDLMKIDNNNPDCPYARRLYVHARCNEIYLENKQKEFETKRNALLNGKNTQLESMKTQVEETKKALEEECEKYIKGEEFTDFAQMVRRLHYRFDRALYEEHGLEKPASYIMRDTDISFGMRAQPLPVLGDAAIRRVIEKLSIDTHNISEKKNYYDRKSQNILLPVEYDINDEICIYVRCSAVKTNICFKGINNFILNRIKRTEPGKRNLVVSFFDALHFNNSLLKALKPLENSVLVDKVPQSDEEIEDNLKRIVSSFPDIDEKLQDAETVQEYNDSDAREIDIEKRIIVINGYPNAYNDSEKKCIDRIIYNHKRYGISLILVENTGYDKQGNKDKDKFGATEDFYIIDMPVGSTSTIKWMDKNAVGFRWYEYDYKNFPLPNDFIKGILDEKELTRKTSDIYTKSFPLDKWNYLSENTEERKNIVLPYGVDGDENIKKISFSGENFAAYLMGASGSGKSTLLHTLITGIIRNYHPDDVELWLADFKMGEFSQYINPMPPHVKYILLDESRELVFDLVDKLTEEMFKRQHFFMKHRKYKKVEELPSNEYMPIIFVILDEFSIMSQVLSDDTTYKLKLQNILAKGRSLGIKFIFSSQSYINGITGLTSTAKEQIQTRIAMKNNKDEITGTLELPRFLMTDQNRFMIETLPVHKALRKYFNDDNEMVLEKVSVMYFAGKDEERYLPQKNMISDINDSLEAIDINKFKNGKRNNYVYKNPIVVDGNSYFAFNNRTMDSITIYRNSHQSEVYSQDVIIPLGTPRRMEKVLYSVLSKESRENILLIGKGAECACVASIVFSSIKSFLYQNGNVQVWAYSRNRLYKMYKSIFEKEGVEIKEGINEICRSIKEIKDNIRHGKSDNTLIVLLGMEQICLDFDFLDSNSDINISFQDKYKTGFVKNNQEEEDAIFDNKVMEEWRPLREKLILQGKDNEVIKKEREKCLNEIAKTLNYDLEDRKKRNNEKKNIGSMPSLNIPIKNEKIESYDASEDFSYIVKLGSRFGYHFMVCLNSYLDIKQMGLKKEFFSKRLSFQVSGDDSREIFGRSIIANNLPEHVCEYDDYQTMCSFRPFLHEGVDWDGWIVENGEPVNPVI